MKALLLVSGLGFLGILSEILNFKKFIYKLSIVGLLAAIVVTFLEWDNPTPAYFNNMVYFDNLAISFIAVLLIINQISNTRHQIYRSKNTPN